MPEDRPARDSPVLTVIVTSSSKAIYLAAKVVFSLRQAFHDILGAAKHAFSLHYPITISYCDAAALLLVMKGRSNVRYCAVAGQESAAAAR
jgi:hypothetical protein